MSKLENMHNGNPIAATTELLASVKAITFESGDRRDTASLRMALVRFAFDLEDRLSRFELRYFPFPMGVPTVRETDGEESRVRVTLPFSVYDSASGEPRSISVSWTLTPHSMTAHEIAYMLRRQIIAFLAHEVDEAIHVGGTVPAYQTADHRRSVYNRIGPSLPRTGGARLFEPHPEAN